MLMLSRRRRAGWLVLLAASACSGVPPAQAHAPALNIRVVLHTLDSRADLIAGPTALVGITGPQPVRVTLDGRNVTRAFARRAYGSFSGLAGLLTTLKPGSHIVR